MAGIRERRCRTGPPAPQDTQRFRGDLRPSPVLATREFNYLKGTALVAPITQSGKPARGAGFTAPLMGSDAEIQGVVVLSAVRTPDFAALKALRIESSPAVIVEDALMRLAGIIGLGG